MTDNSDFSPFDVVNVWAIGTNDNWSEYHGAGLIALGWDSNDPSMAGVSDPDDVAERSPSRDTPVNGNSREQFLYRFVDKVEVGDIVIAKAGVDTPQGIGIVASEYEHDQNLSVGGPSDCHFRRINWQVNLADLDNGLTLEDNLFEQNTAVTKKQSSFEELQKQLEADDSLESRKASSHLNSVPDLAAAKKTHCARPNEATSVPQGVTQLYENYGSGDAFLDNLHGSVRSPLSEEERNEVAEALDKLPDVRNQVRWALEAEHLTAWCTKNSREFHSIQSGDWIAHISGKGTSSVEYLQRADIVLYDLPKPVREEIAESLHGSARYSDIIFSTTPVIEPDITRSEFREEIREFANAGDISPHLYDISGMFQQVNFKISFKGGGANTILENLLGGLGQTRPAVPSSEDASLLTPAGLRGTQNTTNLEPIQDALQESSSQFLLTINSGEYSDEIPNEYHFKEGIPGYDQLKSAIERSEEVPFAALEQQENYWAIVAAGTLGDVQIESINEDGEREWVAKTRRLEWIEPIDLEAVNPLIDKGEIWRRGINELTQQELTVIFDWHHGPGVRAIKEISESDRADLLKEAFAHLIAGRNIVFYGPPGTGKTHAAKQLSTATCGEQTLTIETANAEWTNYDMVGGWAPGPADSPREVDNDAPDWHPEQGIITGVAEDCAESLNNSARPSWLLIDELNRANLDQAFGDVFTLLDLEYRASKALEYANETQPLPYAFRILATQNTYDLAQLFSLGYAFRRRFAFLEVPSQLGSSGSTSVEPSEYTVPRIDASEALESVSASDVEAVASWAADRLNYAEQDEHQAEGAPEIDPRALYPQFASTLRINDTLKTVQERDMGLKGENFIRVVLGLSNAATEHEVIEVGRAIVMDVVAYVLAYELAFPNEADQETVDQACCAYLVPQFENVMSDLRQADALSRDDEIENEFKKIIVLAENLGLSETASRLEDALDSHSILG